MRPVSLYALHAGYQRLHPRDGYRKFRDRPLRRTDFAGNRIVRAIGGRTGASAESDRRTDERTVGREDRSPAAVFRRIHGAVSGLPARHVALRPIYPQPLSRDPDHRRRRISNDRTAQHERQKDFRLRRLCDSGRRGSGARKNPRFRRAVAYLYERRVSRRRRNDYAPATRLSRFCRPAARPLPVAAGCDQSDASSVERRPLEQNDDRARLLLGEMCVLRYFARLYPPVRQRSGRMFRGLDGAGNRSDGQSRFPFRRRSRPAPVAERDFDRNPAQAAERRLVDERALREEFYRRSVPTDGLSGLHRGVGRPGGRFEPFAEDDEQRRRYRTGDPCHAEFMRRRNPGAHVPDVRFPDRDTAGKRRFVGSRAAVVSRRTGAFGILAPLCDDRPQPERAESRRVRSQTAQRPCASVCQ